MEYADKIIKKIKERGPISLPDDGVCGEIFERWLVSNIRRREGAKQIRKKILPQYFKEVCAGRKNFELRKDEDDARVGDELILEEWKPDGGYTGKSISKNIIYILRNVPEYGLMEGYCIIGF